MDILIAPRDELFLDTSFAIALATPNDLHHQSALNLAREVRRFNARLVTTHAVILEAGNSLAIQRYRPAGVRLLRSLQGDKRLTILPLTESLFQDAVSMYVARSDKDWGLVDCISFVVMAERGITKALTADQHFEQAGFQALLRAASV